jgi:hypothetical protein
MHESNRTIESERIEELIERIAALEVETRNLTKELKTLNKISPHKDTKKHNPYKSGIIDDSEVEYERILATERRARVRLLEETLADQANTDSRYSRVFGNSDIASAYHGPNRSQREKISRNTYQFKRGDKVIVNNDYRGQRGTRGTVTRTTDNRVLFFRDTQGYAQA